MVLRGTLLACLFMLLLGSTRGQDTGKRVLRDTSNVFSKIERFSQQRKVTRLVYPLFFKPAGTVISHGNHDSVIPQRSIVYEPFEGRIIRSIQVTSLDPFGTNVDDTISGPVSLLSNAGNKIHVKSLPVTIRNLLLIRKHDRFDSLLVSESERLVRSQRYVREVRFDFIPVGNDSVDIRIREQDVWSLLPDAAFSGSSYKIVLKQQNFLGTGHQLSGAVDRNFDRDANSFHFGYDIPNINNSFINASLSYWTDELLGFDKRVTVERKFFSPFTRWAGGATIEQQLNRDSITIPGILPVLQDYRFNTQDFWLGSAWPMFSGKTEVERITNLVLSARWVSTKYLEKPIEKYDTLNRYADESFLIGSVGVNSRKYVQDKFLFRYNVTEDIPIGRTYNLLFGYRLRAGIKSYYSGLRIASGDYYSMGYVGMDLEGGTFFNKRDYFQGVLAGNLTYFSNLFILDNWKLRQFFKYELTLGLNRYPFENLPFDKEMGKRGFESAVPQSSRKMIFTLQTQSYAPWNLLGFRLGPYLNYTLGFLGNEQTGFRGSSAYSRIGLGIIIRNDFLSTSFFQLSLCYYPIVPGLGRNAFIPNVLRTTDFGLQEFDVGKPAEVLFR